jgi:hypothetical protein
MDLLRSARAGGGGAETGAAGKAARQPGGAAAAAGASADALASLHGAGGGSSDDDGAGDEPALLSEAGEAVAGTGAVSATGPRYLPGRAGAAAAGSDWAPEGQRRGARAGPDDEGSESVSLGRLLKYYEALERAGRLDELDESLKRLAEGLSLPLDERDTK